MSYVENRIFNEIKLGDCAELTKELTNREIEIFAAVSSDLNPVHLNSKFAATTPFKKIIGHDIWSGALISAVLGTKLPGPGTIYLKQTIDFKKPVYIGDKITAKVTVAEKKAESNQIVFECVCLNQDGEIVAIGVAEVKAPLEKIKQLAPALPKVNIQRDSSRLNYLMEKAKEIKRDFRVAVVNAVNLPSVAGAIMAAEEGIIQPIFIGKLDKMQEIAASLGKDLKQYDCIDAPNAKASIEAAVELVKNQDAATLIKGLLHTDELMRAVLSSANGLRTERFVSHCMLTDIPSYHKVAIFTDPAVNINPPLKVKKDIIQNAIDFAIACGIKQPKVALLAAVETISENMPSNLDAAILSKMAQRKEIAGGIVDGPLDFDIAVSKESANLKGFVSEIAGDTDIFVSPTLECANILLKQLEYLSSAQTAGLIVGAKVPIIIVSRSAKETTRLLSCSLAKLLFFHNENTIEDKNE